MSTLSQIREIEQAIQDAEQLYNVLRVFPKDITIGEFEDTIKETLPKEDISVGEGIQQAYSIKQTVQQQMAQAISDLKEYYPGSYFDLIKPYRDPSISNSFRLAVSQLKHDHYGTFEEKLDWIIDVIGRTDPAILEDLKHALKEAVKPPSSKAKAKYDAWVELMEDDRFRRLLAMFGLLYYPTPEEAPPLEDIKRSMETTDYMLEQAKRVTSILSIFKSKRKVQNIKERILANTPADKSKTVEESMNLIEKKIMPELLSERQQLVNQLMREHVESFLEENPELTEKHPELKENPQLIQNYPELKERFMETHPEPFSKTRNLKRADKIVKKVAPEDWQRIMALLRHYGRMTQEEVYDAAQEVYGMPRDAAEEAINELGSAGYIGKEDDTLFLVY